MGDTLVFGISSLHFQWDTLEQAFDRVQSEFQLDLIEFSTNQVEPDQFDDVRRLARHHHVQVATHCWIDPGQLGLEQGCAQLDALLRACQAQGARYMVMHMGTHAQRQQGLATVAQIVRTMVPRCLEAGVTLCLENHYADELGAQPHEFLTVLDAIPRAAAGFALDYGHSNMCANTDEMITDLGHLLVYTHMADNHGQADDHLPMGQGTTDWDRAIRMTLQTGFRGPWTIEFPDSYGVEHFRRVTQRIRELAAEVA